jgi:AraC family transcriptional regulator
MIYRAGSSYILHERASQFYGEGTGWLSLKSFYGGQALYNVGRGGFRLDESAYLVLNHGQKYAITIESDTPVESFCLFFAPGLAEEIYRNLSLSPGHLLAEPAPPLAAPLTFFERTYPHDGLLSPLLNQIHHSPARAEPLWLAEGVHRVMQQLLQRHFNLYREVETLPAARPATREELYRRLHLAREYMAAAFEQPLLLEDIAAVAGLSPNHLLRSFKQLFQQTPYQYLLTRRLDQAQTLLAQTDQSVTDISLAVGFESIGAFSWRFRHRLGLSPTEYRRQKRGESAKPGDFEEAS